MIIALLSPLTVSQAEQLSDMGWHHYCPFLQDWILTSQHFYMRLATSKSRDIGNIILWPKLSGIFVWTDRVY